MIDRRRLIEGAVLGIATTASAAAGATLPRARCGQAGTRGTIHRGYCDGPFGQIHFRTSGLGAPIILCHGAGRTSHGYYAVLPRLAEAGFCAIAFDTPGAGLSDPAPHEPSIEELSTAIDAIECHLGVSSAFIAGHHTGGNMASAFAARRPDGAKALAISGPEAGFHYTSYAETLPAAASIDGAHVMDLWRKLASYRFPSMSPEEMTRNFAYELLARPTSWHLSFATGKFDAARTYSAIHCPTLVLCGRKDGLFAYMDDTRRVRPDFEYAELPGFGLDEAPEAWADAVAQFFSRHRSPA